MKSPYLHATLVTFLLGAIIGTIGLFGLIWPFIPGFRSVFLSWLSSGTWTIPLLGFGLLLLGSILIMFVWVSTRRRYYHVRMGDRTVQVDETLIEGYLQEYWERLFPGKHVANRVKIRREKIYVTCDLPHVPFEQQPEILRRIDSDLSEILSSILDYRKSFWLTASFDEKE